MELDYGQLKQALRDVLAEQGVSSDPPLANRFRGGTLVLKPADGSLSPKEIPIEDFFGKVVRVRDQLRVLEQKINNHDKLSDDERNQLQGYVTRCYGSLTTFNLLFQEKADQFRGQKGK